MHLRAELRRYCGCGQSRDGDACDGGHGDGDGEAEGHGGTLHARGVSVLSASNGKATNAGGGGPRGE